MRTKPSQFPCTAALLIWAVSALPAQVAAAAEAPIASGQQTNGKVSAEILSLNRTEGDTLTLRFAVVNDSNQSLSLTLGNMNLIDLVNRRSYSPGLTSQKCRAEPSTRSICWAVFAAPPANVKTINVQFYEDFDLISVPLSR
jgi:hypothetical protein